MPSLFLPNSTLILYAFFLPIKIIELDSLTHPRPGSRIALAEHPAGIIRPRVHRIHHFNAPWGSAPCQHLCRQKPAALETAPLLELPMIPLDLMPGAESWAKAIAPLLEREEPIWVFGPSGSGISTIGQMMATRRGSAYLDNAEFLSPQTIEQALAARPTPVFGSHFHPSETSVRELAAQCIPFRLPSLEEHPESATRCLAHMAREEGIEEALPTALSRLPCPGQLRGLRNRVVRFKLLRQLPEDATSPESAGSLPLEAEDLATNLHVLERLLLHRALRRSYGNRVEAARRLGVSRRQLYLLIARHGDPVRGEEPITEGPKRLTKRQIHQNSSLDPGHR